MGSRWVSYRIPDVTCNPFSSQHSRERINNDTINLAHFPSRSVPFRCRFVGFAPAGGNREKGGEKGEHEAIKKWGSPQEGLLRPRPHIYHLSAGPSEASGEISEVSVPNSLVHCPARIFSLSLLPPLSLSLPPRTRRTSLVEKFHCFCFLMASPAAINRPGRFSSTLPTETERSANRAKLASDTFRFS